MFFFGDTDFVNSFLLGAEEKISRKQELKNKGYDIKKVAERVAMIYGMDSRDIMSKGRQQSSNGLLPEVSSAIGQYGNWECRCRN